MKNDWKLVRLLVLLGMLGVVTIIPYQFNLQQSTLTLSTSQMITISIISIIQNSLIVFVCVFFGLKLQVTTKLDVPHLRAFVSKTTIPQISLKWVIIGVVVTFIGSIFITLLDKYMFMPKMNIPQVEQEHNIWVGFLTIFYGGITEELMMRLFGMNLIIWILIMLTRKKGKEIPQLYYWIGIIGIAIIFGLSHLPALYGVFGELSSLLVFRTVLLNGILGIWFGYLYWKKGLEYAIISHMAADLFLHVIFPLFL